MLQRFLKRFQTNGGTAKTARRPRMKVESLEPRIVLTGTAMVTGQILTVCGTDANDTIIVAELNDSFFVAADFLSEPMFFSKSQISTVIVEGGAGNDTLVATSMQSPIFLRGEAGNDRIFGGDSGDSIEGGSGDDLIYGNGGDDTIFGGDGVDRVFAGLGDDTVHGGLGNDTLIGMGGADTLNGNAGDDSLSGSAGDDSLAGNDGADQISGGAGNDTAYGGTGNDILLGDGDNDMLFGDDGEDTLLGAGGQDQLNGGAGNDRIVGSNGDDQLFGGDGIDNLFGDDGSDELNGGEGADNLFGGIGRDTLFGNNGRDVLRGGDGDDVLSGQNGIDLLEAGNGKDILIGGELADVLRGGGNEDFLIAGTIENQNDAESLNEYRELWLGSDHFEIRVADLLAVLTLNTAEPGDDLFGGTGSDIFYANSSGDILDRDSSEPVIGESFIAVSDVYFLDIGETIVTVEENNILANDMSFSGGTIEATDVAEFPLHGTITPVNNGLDGLFTYTLDEHGRDHFIYEASDGSGETWLARASFVVRDLPELPPGFLTPTGTGLQVFDFEVGPSISTPTAESIVTVDYVGYLPNGEIFDEGRLTNFALDSLIDGFSEGVQGMATEGRRRIVIPPELGYGSNGNPGAGIGGEDTIIFDVTLLSFATF